MHRNSIPPTPTLNEKAIGKHRVHFIGKEGGFGKAPFLWDRTWKCHMADILLLPYAAQGCGVAAPLAEGATVQLIECPLLVRRGICNLFVVRAMARPLFGKDTVGSLTSTN